MNLLTRILSFLKLGIGIVISLRLLIVAIEVLVKKVKNILASIFKKGKK